jgi:flagellum-specific ATP synthase
MKALAEQIAELDGPEIYGRVAGIRGLMVEVAGPVHAMPVGARVVIETDQARNVPCEVVGFAGDNALLMPFAPLEGVRRGCRALVSSASAAVRPSAGWFGRVMNAMASRSTAKGRCHSALRPIPFARCRRPRMHAGVSVARSILACAP